MNVRRDAIVKTIAGGFLSVLATTGFANVVIDDTAITGDVTVPSGEELEIRGSGLSTAGDYTVTLEGNNTIRFYTTATVAAKISAAAVSLQADDDVTGTFTGGATFGGQVTMKSGDVRFTTKAVSSAGSITFSAGHLTLADGCAWTFSKQWVGLAMTATQTGDACLELATGGSLSVGNNQTFSVGKDANWESKLLLSGGTFRRETTDSINLNASGTGNGVIEIASGTFRVKNAINCVNKTGTAKLILGNGTINGNGSLSATSLVKGGGSCTIHVNGNATIDLGNYSAATVSDFADGTTGTWSCEAGSSIFVKGRVASQVFQIHSACDGLRFAQCSSPAAALTIVGAADPLNLGWTLPAVAGAGIAASGTSPALSVDLWQTAAGVIDGAFDASCFTGFASVSLRNVVLDQPATSRSYVPPRGIAAIPGTVTVNAGTVIFDTAPDSSKVVVAQGVTAYCQDTDPFVMTNRSNTPSADTGWNDPDGVQSAWQPGAVAEIETKGINGSLDGVHVAYGLRVGGAGDHYWDGNNGRFEIGAGGLTFTQSKMWGLAKGAYLPRIVLAANQVWTNAAETGTACMQFGFSYFAPAYYKAYMTAEEGVSDWRLAGNLETWLYSPSNDLRDVTVTVAAPARLCLIGDLDARLNAKELVLEGADMAFGAAGRKDACAMTGSTVAAIDTFHLAPTVTLKDGGTLTADQAETPLALTTLKAVGSGNAIVGESVAITQDVLSVSLPAAGDHLSVEAPVVGNAAAFAVSGAGTLAIPATLESAVAFNDSGALELTGAGTYAGTMQGAGQLIVNASGTLILPNGTLDEFDGTTVTVSAGTLVMANKDEIPSGVTVVTEGSGALVLGDPTGFDPETQMGGTKNLVTSGNLIVTEAVRENETLTVKGGETLQVFGSGLKASSTVTLEDGAAITFYYTATVSAPVAASGAVTLTAVTNVVGTLAGAYVAEISGTTAKFTDIVGDGLVDFAGGATFKNNYSRLAVRGGHACVSAGTMTITKASIQMLAGTLVFTNATLACSGNNATLDLANAAQFGNVLVEFQAGSSWSLGNNQTPIVGYSNEYESRLVLNGGTWGCSTSDGFWLCPNGRGIGIFELRAGRFYSNRRISAGNGGTSKFIWTGGTFGGQWNSTEYPYDHLINGPITEFLIAGDCTLELYRMYKPVVSNFNNAAATMRALPGASLTVVSESTTAGWCTNVVFTNFKGDGMKLVTKKSEKNGYPTVEFADVEGAVTLTHELNDGIGDVGGLVKATGTTPELVVSYEVPSGVTFDAAGDYSYWYEGFSPVTLSNLTFRSGACYRFPIGKTGAIEPFAIAGLLSLPDALNYYADSKVTTRLIPATNLIVPAEGVAGECSWTCIGGVPKKCANVWTEDNVVKFSYAPKGTLIMIR